MAKTHVLRERDCDGDPVIGAFATVKQADAVRTALGQTEDDSWSSDAEFYVDTVEVLAADLFVTDLGTVYGWRLGWYWNGTVRADEAAKPDRRLRITGLPEGYSSRAEPPAEGAINVAVKGDETQYTLGFWVYITSTDEAHVKQAADEVRAQYGADPAAATVAAWKADQEKHGCSIAPWIWQRDENQGLLAALREAGVE